MRVSRLELLQVVSYLTCKGNRRRIPPYAAGYIPWGDAPFSSAVNGYFAKVKIVYYCTLRALLSLLRSRNDSVCNKADICVMSDRLGPGTLIRAEPTSLWEGGVGSLGENHQ